MIAAAPGETPPEMEPRARPFVGAFLFARSLALGAAGLWLSLSPDLRLYCGGQLLLAVAAVQWFVLLHECGHGTLTGVRPLDRWAGRVCGLLALIPFEAWKRVHALHHRWTGWQDKDPTTQGLTPRQRSRAWLLFVDLVWWSGLPLVSVLYRVQNYWALPRLLRQFPVRRRSLALSLLLTAAPWVGLVVALGLARLAWLVGPALLLAFLVEDQIILSQHTHVPQRLAAGERVRPIAAAAQEEYTRSLLVPGLVSRWLLLGVEAHELHHAHPLVPGYRLRELARPTANGVAWWRFLLGSRALRGSSFLYRNRAATGASV